MSQEKRPVLFVAGWDKESKKLKREVGERIEYVDVDEDEERAEENDIVEVPTLMWEGEKYIKPSVDKILSLMKSEEEDKPKEEVGKMMIKKKTRIRMSNLCCEMEMQLVHKRLDDLDGVFEVRVNIIGRMAVITHDEARVDAESLVTELNKVHLGAALSGTTSGESEQVENGLAPLIKWIYPLTVVVLYFIGLVCGIKAVSMVAIVLGVYPLVRGACRALSWGNINVNVLMVLALLGALAIGQYEEAGAIVVSFIVAETIQDECLDYVRRELERAAARSSDGLQADTVIKLIDNNESIVPLSQISVGDIMAARPGERIAVDGIIHNGTAAVDYSALTGESMPIVLKKNDQVLAGGLILNGYIRIKASAPPTNADRLRDMVQEAQASSSKTELLINSVATRLTQVALGLALALVLLGFILNNISFWTQHALVLLVVACPCALVLASPVATASALAAAAKRKALIKSATALESLATIDTVALDKTGTLTQGHCRVVKQISLSDQDDRHALLLAAALETRSAHPLAAAIVSEATGCVGNEVSLSDNVTKFKVEAGGGISGDVDGAHVTVGNAEFCHIPHHLLQTGQSIYVAINNTPRLALEISDPLRPEATEAITRLRALDLDLAVLTGDQPEPAFKVAHSLGIANVLAGLKPESKLQWVRKAQSNKRSVLMVGDGINDAPALSLANVGAAMAAGGSVLALQAADLGILSDDLRRLPDTVALARFCKLVIAQNIAVALFLKLFIIVFAALMAGKPRLWQAILADAISLLIVLTNGIRPLAFFSSPLVSSSYFFNLERNKQTKISPSYSAVRTSGEDEDIESGDAVITSSTHSYGTLS